MNHFIFSYVRNKLVLFLNSYKFLLCVLAATALSLNTIYQLKYVQHWPETTMPDAMLYEFALYSVFYLLIAPLNLYIVYDIEKPNDIDNYTLIRIGRKNLFRAKIWSCVSIVLIYIFILVLSSVIILSFRFKFSTQWGSFLIDSHGLNYALIHPSLFSISACLSLLLQLGLLFFSLCAFGWLLILLMELMKHKATALITMLTFNFVCLVFTKQAHAIPIILPQSHTFLSFIDISNNYADIGSSVIYWIVFMMVLYLLMSTLFQQKDYIYENASDTDT